MNKVQHFFNLGEKFVVDNITFFDAVSVYEGNTQQSKDHRLSYTPAELVMI